MIGNSEVTRRINSALQMELKSTPFPEAQKYSLWKYKEDLGKPFARITLFLCPLVDTSDSEPEPEPELEPEETWSDLERDDWLNDIPDIVQGSHYKYLFWLRSFSKT